MRRGKVLNLSRFRFTEFLSKNGLFVGLGLCFLIGIILGSNFWDKTSSLANFSNDYFNDFLTVRLVNSFFKIFINSFLNSMMNLLLIFILGSSMFGVILIPLGLAYKGFTYGCLSACIYSQYLLKGVAFNAVIVLPFSCLLVVALLGLAVEAVKFSFNISKLTMPSAIAQNLFYTFKQYFIKFIIFSLIILLSSLVDAMICSLFISNFNF